MPQRPSDPDSRELVYRLVEEMREEYAHAGRNAPQSSQRRLRFWVLAVLGALLVMGLEITWLATAERDPGPPPPARLVAQYQDDHCAQRQLAILHAIADYQQHHGEAPQTLELLGPPQLTVAPVDPASGQPYIYEHQGEHVALVCPNPNLHAFQAVPWRH